MTPPWPMCAVCRRPVEEMHASRDVANAQQVFIVRCHGQREETRLGEEFFVAGEPLGVGLAFASPALTEPPRALTESVVLVDGTKIDLAWRGSGDDLRGCSSLSIVYVEDEPE